MTIKVSVELEYELPKEIADVLDPETIEIVASEKLKKGSMRIPLTIGSKALSGKISKVVAKVQKTAKKAPAEAEQK